MELRLTRTENVAFDLPPEECFLKRDERGVDGVISDITKPYCIWFLFWELQQTACEWKSENIHPD